VAPSGSFYQHVYDWQGVQHDTLLFTLLKNCHRLMSCQSLDDACELISQAIMQLQFDGYYRLEVCGQVYIEHFKAGQHGSYHGDRPQKGSDNRAIKVVELEHALIFKMRFIQLYITKTQDNLELLEDSQSILLLWLMQVESLCMDYALHHFLHTELNTEQQNQADSMNLHFDLEVSLNRLDLDAKDMTQAFNESVIPLLTPTDFIDPMRRQQLLITALTAHQEHLSQLVKQQFGLYLSTQRMLEALGVEPH